LKAIKFVLFLFSSILLAPHSLRAMNRLDLATIDEYLKIHKEFTHALCTPQKEQQYNQLLKDYQVFGNYIPTQLDEKLDLKTIKSMLPLIDEKILWLKEQKNQLDQLANFEQQKKETAKLKKLYQEILDLKRDHFTIKHSKENLQKAREKFVEFKQVFDGLKTKVPFLLSFKFPVNHLLLRSEYEKYKESMNRDDRQHANMIFFFRKIVQDGTLDENFKSDLMYRSMIDTLSFSLNAPQRREEHFFFTENERVDLAFFIRQTESSLQKSPKVFTDRFSRWIDRTEQAKLFYADLSESKKIQLAENMVLDDIKSLLEYRAKSLYNLKDFALKNLSQTYEFWSKKSELFQSLFVLETILYNEVGRVDDHVDYYRKDVAAVVLNRVVNSQFNQFSSKDALVKYLNKDLKTAQFPWLNVLFKEGEFSFTYFYIAGNLQIYCPDMTRNGIMLRKDNLKIAMEALNYPQRNFQGLRYYSRVSMLGRIEMDSIWSEYKAIEEAPGIAIELTKNEKQLYKKGQYKFLYEFAGPQARLYWVIEIKGRALVVNKTKGESQKFYTYRNPHFFRFFSLKT